MFRLGCFVAVTALSATGFATKADDAAAAQLRAFGVKLVPQLDSAYPEIASKSGDDRTEIFTQGPCERLNETERAAVEKRVAAFLHHGASLVFGCKDPDGTIVDATWDDVPKKRRQTWTVMRVSAKSVSTIATYSGQPQVDWSEWADEQTLSTLALADVDGDGKRDVVLRHTKQEGGSMGFEWELSVQRSSDHKLVKLGSLHGTDIHIARGSTFAGLVLASANELDSTEAAARFTCVNPPALGECPASVEAARIDHAREIARWFATGHEYEPLGSKVPDRDQLGEMLDVLRVQGPDRTKLLAAVAETPASYRMQREIAAKLIAQQKLPDTRAVDLMNVLGDTKCTRCEYKVVTSKKKLGRDQIERTDRLVYKGKTLASITVRGPAAECGPCGTAPPEQGFSMKTYRNGAHIIALVQRSKSVEDSDEKRASTLSDDTLTVFIDGTLVETVATAYPWFSLDGLETHLVATAKEPRHWPEFTDATKRWLDGQAALSAARARLATFDVTRWSDANYQAQIKRDRSLLGI